MSTNPRTIFEVPRVASPAYTLALPHLVNPPMLWEGIDVVADPIIVRVRQRGNISHTPPAAINPALNIYIAATSLDLVVEVLGTWLNVGVIADPIEVVVTIPGTMVIGKLFSNSALIAITVSMGSPEIVTVGVKKSWVKWGNIGNLDFTIWKDNVAGERPLDWKGWVYAIKKLGNKVIVYGEGGVSVLAPAGNTFGLFSAYKVGLKGKHAVAGDDKIHFFIDAAGVLFSIGEIAMKSSLFESSIIPERLDYSEYLSLMNNPVLSWDALNKLLYICDGLSGYVYSPDDKSLGSGPNNITGIGSQGGTFYVTASAAIVTPIFEICTDIYDMGSRKNKTISTVELGTDVTGDLWVALDYRMDKAAAFKTLGWHKVSPNGVTNIPCYGVEFRVRVKRTTYEYFELDYIRVNGIVHDYNFQYPYVGR
jgi:hypothetical protein